MKNIIKGTHGSQVIHSSDGKDAPMPVSAGQPMAVATVGGKTTAAHGQVTASTVVFDSPA